MKALADFPLVEVTTVTAVTAKRIELTRDHIRRLIPNVHIPVNAAIYMEVPGGGEWSIELVHVNSDCPLIITWEEIS